MGDVADNIVGHDGRPVTDAIDPAVQRRTFMGCACAAAAVALAGCNNAAPRKEVTPFTTSTGEIPVGAGKIFFDYNTVVTQPREGDFRAFSAVCPHQGCIVNDIADGLIRCPCHGSRFRITDGSPEHGPAQEPLARLKFAVEGTDMWIG